MIQDDVIYTAKKYMGMTERKNHQVLSELIGVDVLTTPWCAAFVNAILRDNGIEGTNSNLARSFLKWGTKTNDPQPGDIVVFQRGNDGWSGHVTFVLGSNDHVVRCLGGNQGDSVSIETYNTDHVLGYRTYND